MARKTRPEKVNPNIGLKIVAEAKDRQSSWTTYIIAHYRATGNLAPNCDARDWYAFFDANKEEKE